MKCYGLIYPRFCSLLAQSITQRRLNQLCFSSKLDANNGFLQKRQIFGVSQLIHQVVASAAPSLRKGYISTNDISYHVVGVPISGSHIFRNADDVFVRIIAEEEFLDKLHT